MAFDLHIDTNKLESISLGINFLSDNQNAIPNDSSRLRSRSYRVLINDFPAHTIGGDNANCSI